MDIQYELLKLARFVYTYSLKKLGLALPANKHLLAAPKQASAYLSTIIYHETLEQMAKYSHQAESIKSLLDRDHFHKSISEKALGREVNYLEVDQHIEPIRVKLKQADFIHNVLNNWCEEWLISRVKTVTEEGEEGIRKKTRDNKRTASEFITDLRNDTYDKLDKLMTLIRKFGNHAVPPSSQNSSLTMKKATIQSYFAIQKDRLDVLSISSS